MKRQANKKRRQTMKAGGTIAPKSIINTKQGEAKILSKSDKAVWIKNDDGFDKYKTPVYLYEIEYLQTKERTEITEYDFIQ